MLPASYIDIDAKTLRRLYVDERLPMTAIATRLGCSPITEARRLRLHEIALRPRGPLPLGRTASAPRDGWCPELAWAIGVIATDGNLSPDGRHLVVRSKDLDMLETLRRCLGLTTKIALTSNGRGGRILTLQWSGRSFYRWLLDIGLMPAKSLTLGQLAVPDKYFPDFFRGCVDGDGSVRVYTDRYYVPKNGCYVYETPLCLDCLRELCLHRVVTGNSCATHWREWIADCETQDRRAPVVEVMLRKGEVD